MLSRSASSRIFSWRDSGSRRLRHNVFSSRRMQELPQPTFGKHSDPVGEKRIFKAQSRDTARLVFSQDAAIDERTQGAAHGGGAFSNRVDNFHRLQIGTAM